MFTQTMLAGSSKISSDNELHSLYGNFVLHKFEQSLLIEKYTV